MLFRAGAMDWMVQVIERAPCPRLISAPIALQEPPEELVPFRLRAKCGGTDEFEFALSLSILVPPPLLLRDYAPFVRPSCRKIVNNIHEVGTRKTPSPKFRLPP